MTDTLVAPSAIEQGLLSSCLSRGADYEVYTGSMQVDENAEAGKYVVSMIGSSTVQDLQGDTMTLAALDDMTRIPDNLTCYMNHSYNLPDDVYGGLYGRPWISSSKGIADYHLKIETEDSNPKAMQTYNMISRSKRRLGCSVGCQVLDYDYNNDTGTLIIKSVYVVEYSLVSIPANQRCWVEVATKSLFERSLMDGRGDDALRLASAVRGMFSRSYDTIIKHIESPGLKRDLERAAPRNTVPHRIMVAFNDGEPRFALAGKSGITKSLSRDEVSALLTKSTEQNANKDILSTNTGGELIRQDLTEDGKDNDMKVKASDVEVKEDGTHAACTGAHTHSGSEHSHDDDASHAEKSVEPEVVKEQEVETTKEDESTPPETTPEVQKEAEPEQTQEIDTERLGVLSVYNMLGKQLGFEPASLEVKKGIGNPDDLQQLITCVSEADRYIDQAMSLIGIPDADGYSSPMNSYGLDVQFQKALTDALTIKAGKALSAANADIVKAMHDHGKATHDLCAAMHPDSCKCDSMGNQGTDVQNAKEDAEFQMGNESGSKAYEPLVEAMASLTDALKGLDMPAIQSQVNSAQGALDAIKKQLSAKGQELNNLSRTMETLKHAPLGRPTQLNRSTVPGEASYLDMKVAGGGVATREDVVNMTVVKHSPVGMQRHWPASVGSELRPALTNDQKSLMHPYAVMAYQDGEDVDVPMVDDPFSN